MAGQIKSLIDCIIEQKAKGNAALVPLAKAKLTMKGIDPDHYDAHTPDDPAVLEKLTRLAGELGLSIPA